MNAPKSFDDNSLFSRVEQQRLHMFLDDLDGGNNNSITANPTTNVIPTAPAPILLSSPFQVQGTNNMYHPPQQHKTHNNSIHINSLLLPTQTAATKVTKKYQKKKRPSLTNSSSTTTSSSSSAGEDLNRKPAANTKKAQQENRKQAHELLSDDQKRANHIASEQKRRANIRIGFEKLVDIVPTLSNGYKSEALILQKSVEHLRQLVESKTRLKEKARQLQLMLGEIPDDDSSEGEMDYRF